MNDLLSLFGGDDFNKEKGKKGRNAKDGKTGTATKEYPEACFCPSTPFLPCSHFQAGNETGPC